MASRLLQSLELNIEANTELKLIIKYGMDGTNVKTYKQKANDPAAYCNGIFCVSLLPLQLLNKDSKEVYWLNKTASSTRFCRPIKILYEKETDELSMKVYNSIIDKIACLQSLNSQDCFISFDLLSTMNDGKVKNNLNILYHLLSFSTLSLYATVSST